jgi:hypothetical protein
VVVDPVVVLVSVDPLVVVVSVDPLVDALPDELTWPTVSVFVV